MKMSNYLLSLALVAVMGSAVFATNPSTVGTTIASQLCQLKALIVTILPTIALIMILIAGLAYAAGQAFGAETKAKAQGWAMSLLVGGIVGILLVVVAPVLIDAFAGMSGSMKTLQCY